MIKLLARSTNNTEAFLWTKEPNLSANNSQHFSLVCMRYLASTGPMSHFVVCFNVLQIILFDQITKYLVCVRIFCETKLQTFVKM